MKTDGEENFVVLNYHADVLWRASENDPHLRRHVKGLLLALAALLDPGPLPARPEPGKPIRGKRGSPTDQ